MYLEPVVDFMARLSPRYPNTSTSNPTRDERPDPKHSSKNDINIPVLSTIKVSLNQPCPTPCFPPERKSMWPPLHPPDNLHLNSTRLLWRPTLDHGQAQHFRQQSITTNHRPSPKTKVNSIRKAMPESGGAPRDQQTGTGLNLHQTSNNNSF